jgi:ABC-type lipoprotein export system ATPase subunit
VFQSGQLVPELTAEENVALPLLLSGMRRAPAMATARTSRPCKAFIKVVMRNAEVADCFEKSGHLPCTTAPTKTITDAN